MMTKLNGNTAGSLSQVQRSILIGSMLGDGTLRKANGKKNALFEVNHAYQYKEYVDWKYQNLKEFVLTPPKMRNNNGNRIAYRFTTRSLPVFTDFYQKFYCENKKKIYSMLELDDLALAVWFMDDGSKSYNSIYLNTQQFSADEQIFLLNILKEQYGIIGNLNRDKKYFRIRITVESAARLKTIVRPHILSVFRYKLGDNPVTTDPKGEDLTLESSQHADPCQKKIGYGHN